MKEDKLEQFMLDYRDEFDELEPDPQLWENIKPQKENVFSSRWMSITWKVAAGIALFIGSYFFHDFMNRDNQAFPQDEMMASEEPTVRELIEAEAYYTSKINSREEELFRYSSGLPQLQEEIKMEMEDLDKIFIELKNDLKDNVDNDEIIEAMIQNYRMKLEILEEILIQLKKSEIVENDENEKNERYEL